MHECEVHQIRVITPMSLLFVRQMDTQQMFCCLVASLAGALVCVADAEFCVQMMVQAVVACPESEYRDLLSSSWSKTACLVGQKHRV